MGGRFLSLPRRDLAATIFCKIERAVETIFGDSVFRIDQDEKRVRVKFERGGERDFDLVIGADGLHSRVRELVFGAEQRFEKYLGYMVAGFQSDGYRPRDELVYLMFTELGQQVMRFSMRDDSTMFLFTFADDEASGASANDLPAQKALLRARFEKSGWECPQILDQLDNTCDLYFDRVSQIRMDEEPGLWTRGRVTLIGDAACCVSLLAGQGSALAMVAAYILAGELHRAEGDYAKAFASYQALFAPFVRQKQEAALRFRVLFGPKSKAAMFVRNQVMNLVRYPWIARAAFSRDLVDKITLPEY
jgi:2-polyprenyl-6-methoxyphenol hydroxylase-like FAD-dependent oxidoreductase